MIYHEATRGKLKAENKKQVHALAPFIGTKNRKSNITAFFEKAKSTKSY